MDSQEEENGVSTDTNAREPEGKERLRLANSWKQPKIAARLKIVLGILLAVAGAAFYLFLPDGSFSNLDSGSVATFLATLGGYFVAWGYVFNDFAFSKLKKTRFAVVYIIPLLAVLFVTTWAAVRVISLDVIRSLSYKVSGTEITTVSSSITTITTVGQYNFGTAHVFDAVGWVLIPFLVFTIVSTLWSTSSRGQGEVPAKKLIQVVLIALTISVLLTTPRLTDSSSYPYFQPFELLPILLVVEIGSITGLLYVYKNLDKNGQ